MDSLQLLYLLYGGNDVYRQEAKFSILSALREQRTPGSFTITVMTDEPQAFEGWPVNLITLTAATLVDWKGNNGYTHRRKACAIAAGVKLADKTIFVDTDTVFFKDPAILFERITEHQYLMDQFEWSWHDAAKRPIYRRFVTDLVARGKAPQDTLKLYNSGICGIVRANASLMDGVIALIDEWAEHGATLHTIEQIAVSFMMGDAKVVTAHDCVNHYYSRKRYHHAMNKGFFEQYGEPYRAELPLLSRSVPVFFPEPGLLTRLMAKIKLLAIDKPFRQAAKMIIYGQSMTTVAYLEGYCRDALWSRAIELLQLKEASPAQVDQLIKVCLTPAKQADFKARWAPGRCD